MTDAFPSLLGDAHLLDLARLASAAPPGDFVEVGVYMGGSAHWLYDIACQQGRTLHLYDTFTGHPLVDGRYDDLACHYEGRFNEAQDALDTLREQMPRAQFHVGIFPATWQFGTAVAFCHSDLDVYWPTEAVCRLVVPALVPGGMILFDDYPWEGCPGVKRAVHEVLGHTDRLTIRNTGKALYTMPA